MNRNEFEIMAPVGSPESFAAALRAGADSIYFGIENLNMRAHSASTFSIDDLKRIAEECRLCGVKSYLTVNTIIYGEDLPLMRQILDAAKEAGISAVIASDIAVMTYCNQIGQEVHLSTQLNISNIEALKFYAQFADVVVLARELNLDQVAEIHRQIEEQHICGPKGELIRIEMFCHGALCMAISGKCYLSQSNWGRSANRGECMQLCRRRYTVRDAETDTELDIENKYIMSPRDLKTIRFLDRMMEAGVRVFKIEGRARGAEYVDTVVRCYKEAIDAVLASPTPEGEKVFNEAAKDAWDERLSRVFNRGFWDGYYQGQTIMDYTDKPGSVATEKKVYCAKGIRYYSKLQVAEFKVEACPLHVGDKVLITGPTTGAYFTTIEEIRYDLKPVEEAQQGWRISIPVDRKIRPSDKLFVLVHNS
ncbi:MAG: U32 family peptidase [Bacteroidaceae bacterium]|nr:U32 family peptidase [Bacteroidaceae bacterium]